MNQVSLVGRLTRDCDLRYSQGETSIALCNLNLAVDRKYKREGQPTADFINCKAFGKTAEFIEKYFKKGNRIGLTGSIQTGNYEKDGKKIYTTDVLIDSVEFVESKGNSNNNTNTQQNNNPNVTEDGFMNIPEGLEDELPFS